MQTLLQNNAAEKLRAYIIWLPILDVDSKELALRRTKLYSDKRLTYFWDGQGLTGNIWQKVLELDGVAWDVYMLYAAGTSWKEEPTRPDFWMHQLTMAKELAPFLNRQKLELKIEELLKENN